MSYEISDNTAIVLLIALTMFIILYLIYWYFFDERPKKGKEISALRVKRERILLRKIERRDLTIQKLRFEIKTLKDMKNNEV